MFVPNMLRCWVSATMQASAPTQHREGQAPLSRHFILPCQLLCHLILTFAWLSQYERVSLLGLRPALIGIGSTLQAKFESR